MIKLIKYLLLYMFLLVNNSYGSRHHGGASKPKHERRVVAKNALHDYQCRPEERPREYYLQTQMHSIPRTKHSYIYINHSYIYIHKSIYINL